MAVTISTIGGDNRILLGNTQYFGRAFSALNSHTWTTARVGVRYCSSDTGANVTPAVLRIGLAAGASFNGMAAGNPVHAVQVQVTGNSTTWTRSTSATRYLHNYAAGEAWRNGVVTAGSASDLEDGSPYFGAGDSLRTLLLVDITKGSPNWSFKYFRNTSATCADQTSASFNFLLGQPVPTLTNHAFCAGSTIAASSINEATYGYFSHVFMCLQSAITFKISDFGAAILA